MYNRLFTQILDSSIWLEPDPTRLVWVTCLAVMDEDGVVRFASIANLARRANVSLAAAQKAIARLEGPDAESSDPEHDGRRLERIPGGWIVLNACKYNTLATRAIQREQTRQRVAKHRATHCNAPVTPCNDGKRSVLHSYSDSDSDSYSNQTQKISVRKTEPHSAVAENDDGFAEFWRAYPNKREKRTALKAWRTLHPDADLRARILAALARQVTWSDWTRDSGQYIPHPATWLNAGSWDDEPKEIHGAVTSAVTAGNVAAMKSLINRMKEAK